GVQEATVLTASGRLIASASEDVTKLLPDLPGVQLLRQARVNRGYAAVDSAAGRPLSLRVVVPMGPMALSDEARFLQLRQSVATESFNSMTRQLAEARRVVEANRIALEAAKGHLENILANLSAGVLVFDHELQLTISNRGAAAILGAEAESFASRMQELFREHREKSWELELTLKGTGKTLHARGARLPQATGGGYVAV